MLKFRRDLASSPELMLRSNMESVQMVSIAFDLWWCFLDWVYAKLTIAVSEWYWSVSKTKRNEAATTNISSRWNVFTVESFWRVIGSWVVTGKLDSFL